MPTVLGKRAFGPFCLHSVQLRRSCFGSGQLSGRGLATLLRGQAVRGNRKEPSGQCQTSSGPHQAPVDSTQLSGLLFSFSKTMYIHCVDLGTPGKHWEENEKLPGRRYPLMGTPGRGREQASHHVLAGSAVLGSKGSRRRSWGCSQTNSA